MAEEIVIPDKPAFKASEVCELLKLQPYVLKSWENEFKDLGVAKTAGGPRVYRRVDVQRAVRIRELVLREGLTLAGVRRRLEQEAATANVEDELIAEIAAASTPAAAPERAIDRERVLQVKQGLRALLERLSQPAVASSPSAVDDAASAATEAPTPKAAARQRLRRSAASAAPTPDDPPPASEAPQDPAPEPVSGESSPDEAQPTHEPVRELTVVADEAPSLFGDDEPLVARDDAFSKSARRRRTPTRPGTPPAE